MASDGFEKLLPRVRRHDQIDVREAEATERGLVVEGESFEVVGGRETLSDGELIEMGKLRLAQHLWYVGQPGRPTDSVIRGLQFQYTQLRRFCKHPVESSCMD